MNANTTFEQTERTTTVVRHAPEVWERVWRHDHPAEKDDRLLARERRSPRWRLLVDYLCDRFGDLRGLRTVELGSGRGDLSALLAERGAKVTLLDASDTALAQARRRFTRLHLPARYVKGDLFHPPLELKESFDVSLSSGVIEHFRGADRTRSIEAHMRVLAPGGATVISVPHAHCPSYRIWKAYLELRGWWPYGMELPYASGEMRRRAGEAGLVSPVTHAVGLWQSIGDHLLKTFGRSAPDWVDRPSRLDARFGGTLILFAQRPHATADHVE